LFLHVIYSLPTTNLLVSPFFAKNIIMQIVVLSNAVLKEELLHQGTEVQANITWVDEVTDFLHHATADAFIDLLFENTIERIAILQQLLPKIVIINSVTDTLQSINPSFVRLNGWPTFLQAPLVEAASVQEELKEKSNAILALFGKQIEWLPDEPGFVTPRIISMIINEAYFALAEGVSTPQEVDTAMKLGTAYPYGPFEWGRKIGLQNIATLLTVLSKEQKRYKPSELLVQETNKAI
jgi:3-hydroxybutyryl-CoA dehydrogenase